MFLKPLYNGSGLNLQPGQSTTVTIGNYDFDSEGAYEITAQVNLSEILMLLIMK